MYDVLVSLLTKLNANTELKAIVSSINPFGVVGINKAYYKYINLTSDKVKGQARFEITAICDNYINSIKAIEQVKRTILTLGDSTLDNNILSVTLNGGGSLRNLDTNTYHESAFFTITYKERI